MSTENCKERPTPAAVYLYFQPVSTRLSLARAESIQVCVCCCASARDFRVLQLIRPTRPYFLSRKSRYSLAHAWLWTLVARNGTPKYAVRRAGLSAQQTA